MRAQLHVHAGESKEPERAAQLVAAELLPGFPRQRPVTLALVALGPHPGLTPTPWLLDGLLAALSQAGRGPIQVLTIGDHETGEALLRKTGSELLERPSRDRNIDLRVDGHHRPLSIPREVVGSSLILCAPLCFEATNEGGGPTRRWQGPLTSALVAFARARGFCPPTPRLRTGLRPRHPRQIQGDARTALDVALELLAATFASSAVVLDGTWASALELGAGASVSGTSPRGPDGRATRFPRLPTLSRRAQPPSPTLLAELATPDRMLGLAALDRLGRPALLGVDRWLAAAFGLGEHAQAHEHAPQLPHSPGRWPQLSPTPTRSQPQRLADRAIAGIRTQSKRLRGAPEQAALPARVPGEFAQLWTRRWYGEHDLARPHGAQHRPSPSLRPR